MEKTDRKFVRCSPLRTMMILALFVTQPAISVAADLHVDPNRGDDRANGHDQPVKSIAAAIRLATAGDTIHLLPNTTYRDWAGFFDKSGEADKPITLDGHGATLDGCDPLNADGWTEVEPGLFRHDDLLPLTDAIVDRWFFVLDGRLNRMRRCSKGPSEPLKSPDALLPNEWTFVKDDDRSKAARAGYIHGSFWLKLLPGKSLSQAGIEIPFRPAGVLIRGTSSHLVVRNVTATRPYNDGFNLSDCQDVRFENIRAIDCGDDGISAHGHCRYSVDGFASIGNATGICDTGTSQTSYQNVLIRDCIGFDLFFLDSGTYSIRDAEIISSAAKSLYLQGRDVPAEPCRVTLDNVIIRRIGAANEVRVSPNCVLKADRLTLLNLDIQAPGGEIELKRSFIGGTVATNPERKPHLHLWKDTRWRGDRNWYDFDSARVGQEFFTATLFQEFSQAVEAEHASRWFAATEAETQAAGIGAVLMTAQTDALNLAADGTSPYVIVIPAQPSVEESTAAEWLATTLKQVTGADFAIHREDAENLPQTRLLVGDTAAARESGFGPDNLKPEEWRIKTVGQTLILTGGRPRGIIYAVCEFLEAQIGVARLDPFTEFVPKQATLTIPGLDRSGRPAFPNRFMFTGWPYQNSLPQGVNGNRWRIWNKEHIYAGPTNGDYPRAVPDGVHTFGHFISAKEFAAEHPEYFSMDADGKRMTDDKGNKQLWIQLCVTNPDVRRITLERAKQMLHDDEAEAKKTGRAPARMVVLSQNDNTSNLCLCPNCKAISDREGSESGALLDYVNHVARGLKEEFPDVTVQTEAYNFTLAPPKTIRPEPNVMIRYCDNYGLSDMTRPLTDPRNAERLALLDGWAKSAQQIGIWDYWRTFDPHPPGLFAPSSNVRAMHRDIQLFRERNVKYVTLECEDFMGAGLNDAPASNDLQSFMPLRAWLGMKLIDDPSRELEPLLQTFCKGYYGAAAGPMRELLEIIEERQSQIEANSSNMRRHVWLQELCDATFFANAYRCLDAGTLAVKDDAASLVHVRRERIIIDSAFLWIEASVRRQNITMVFPLRDDVLKRHRADWQAYVASVYDEAGQKAIAPLIEPGLQLLEKLQTADTDSTCTAIATMEAAITHDGLLNESFWQEAPTLRLLPRDPMAANDDDSGFRFAWTADALFVGIEQPLDKAAAIYEVSLMTPDRTGTQVALHAQPSGSVAAYFYAYPATGMVAVPNRRSLSKFVSSETETHFVAEFRIPWTDLPVEAKPGDDLLLNIATFPKLDSSTPTCVSSPWLIGASPTYNPAYYGTIHLAPDVPVAAAPAHRLIVGWDDAVIVCGPGTVAGMDSPQAIERMVKRWKGRGYQGIYWRVDEAMLPDQFMTRWNPKVSPGVNYLLERVDQKLHDFPVLKTLLVAADREQLEVWAWYPTIYSNGAPSTGPGFTQAWLYENKFGTDHPEVLSIDRAGNKQFMVWEYAYPEARKAKVSEFVQFAKDYGFKRFVACLRTEAAQMQPAPKHADQFGFNTPVVEAMKQRYGIDILTDPRFHYSNPKFDVRDPMVESWRELRGEYLTQFYRELRAALNEVDPTIQIAVQIPGDRAGTCLGNWHLDWRTWVDEGLVNELVVPVVLDGYEGYGPRARPSDFGYIDGAVTVETVRRFVEQSRQPTVRVIQAGGPASNYHTPPPFADGWRLDAWHDLWFYNMAERWEQWQHDITDFGSIRFIEQSFDEFPIGNDAYGGGFGDFCHRPDLRYGPGYWERLGDGTDELPHAQNRVRRGAAGNAIKLSRADGGLANLTVRHHSRHDRSAFPFPGDTAISSGTCQLDFWLYRPNDKSAAVVTLQYDHDPAHRHNVALYITAGDPAVIHFTQDNKYVASTATLAVNKWQRVTMKVDLERKTYSAETLIEDTTDAVAEVICQDVPYAAEFNAFNMIEFSPQGATGSEFYLDDTSLRWTPTPNFERTGTEMLLQASFEPEANDRWTMREGQATDIAIDNDVSFGHELHSLRMRGSGGRVQTSSPEITWHPDGLLLVDCDIFLRSDLPYVQITPGPNVTSSDEVGLALVTTADNNPLIELRTHQGTWQYLDDDTLTDTKVSAAFDAWNHVQLVIDPVSESYSVLLQVIGEPPRLLCRGSLVRPPAVSDKLGVEFFCSRSKSHVDGPAFDNLRVTRRILKVEP